MQASDNREESGPDEAPVHESASASSSNPAESATPAPGKRTHVRPPSKPEERAVHHPAAPAGSLSGALPVLLPQLPPLPLFSILAVWATFFIFGLVAAPIPGINEPHYLGMARHFWDSSWCPDDFFLNSSQPHWVFYVTIGWMTKVFPLWMVALIGRLIATALLAVGWALAVQACTRSPTAIHLSCVIFTAISSVGNLSGEWVLGGVEGKVFSYALLLMSWGCFHRGQHRIAAITAGLAVSFHPLVGLWGLLTFSVARLAIGLRYSYLQQRDLLDDFLDATWPRLNLKHGLLLIGAALPGLIPALMLLAEGAPADVRHEANYIQVFYRLAHHLDPMTFPVLGWIGYFGLLIQLRYEYLCMREERRPSARERVTFLHWEEIRFQLFAMVLTSMVIAILGILVSVGPRPIPVDSLLPLRLLILKFYPCRFFDALLPMAVAILLARRIESTAFLNDQELRRQQIRNQLMAAMIFCAALGRGYLVTLDQRYQRMQYSDWIATCTWIREHTPSKAIILSPHNAWAFKWYADRAEYVTVKDCPQDAAGIVEWNRRLLFLQDWFRDKYADQRYTVAELRELAAATGVAYLVTERLGPIDASQIYQNETYRIYDFQQLELGSMNSERIAPQLPRLTPGDEPARRGTSPSGPRTSEQRSPQ